MNETSRVDGKSNSKRQAEQKKSSPRFHAISSNYKVNPAMKAHSGLLQLFRHIWADLDEDTSLERKTSPGEHVDANLRKLVVLLSRSNHWHPDGHLACTRHVDFSDIALLLPALRQHDLYPELLRLRGIVSHLERNRQRVIWLGGDFRTQEPERVELVRAPEFPIESPRPTEFYLSFHRHCGRLLLWRCEGKWVGSDAFKDISCRTSLHV